ncbi:hypothetical protein [Sporolactobacillus pectinivorans]|uniref:hypothetical protein n=1 Tax=Sporolactobacillus pectinivorans TaxID=1591408 RepID=UPI0012FD7703|nr:hypothetical protein [Sporolactobacillus pectinivorans]
MKKAMRYLIFFVASLLIQWVWYAVVSPGAHKSLLDMLLASLVFIFILFMLDLVPRRR